MNPLVKQVKRQARLWNKQPKATKITPIKKLYKREQKNGRQILYKAFTDMEPD